MNFVFELGPPPPPTNQYYLHPYMGPGGSPFFPDPSHSIYRNMLVPPYNTPYHMQIARFPTPEDLSRNTKALDLLQQHASQYYNTHKIHELSDRVNHLKSPTSNPAKMQTSSILPSPQSMNQSMNSVGGGNSSLQLPSNNNLNNPASVGNSSLPSKNVNINVNTEKLSSNDSEEQHKDKDNSNCNEHDEDDNLSYNNNNERNDDNNGNNNNSSNDNNTNKSNDNDSSNSSPSNHTISNANNASSSSSSQVSGANKISADRNDHSHVGVYPMPMYPAPYVNR